jgi:hypothetical protein
MAATTPGPEQPQRTGGSGGGMGSGMGMGMSIGSGARMPIPGNAEFVFFVVMVILVAIIAAILDEITASEWLVFTTVAAGTYLLSRGIAKASRVLEQ